MRIIPCGFSLLCLFFSAACPGTTHAGTWKLVWADEFNGPAGSAPDARNWAYDLGGGGWGNQEEESYTDRRQNSFMDGKGHLVIEARREAYAGRDGIRRDYSSARLKSQGLQSFTHGFIESSIQVPAGQGLWPAFWMLGESIQGQSWPACGEIDIMENLGKEPSTIHGTLHGPGYSGSGAVGNGFSLHGGMRFSDGFHTFAIEWSAKDIKWYVDRELYHEASPQKIHGGKWVFDSPFFLLLNVAVGGAWPGKPDASTRMPQRMLVDYIRVYQAQP